jgi:hypothetical protein
MAKKTSLVTSYRLSWFFLLTSRVGLELNPCKSCAIVIGTARAPYLGGFIRGEVRMYHAGGGRLVGAGGTEGDQDVRVESVSLWRGSGLGGSTASSLLSPDMPPAKSCPHEKD